MILQQKFLAKLPLRPPPKLLVTALPDGIGAEFPLMLPEGFQQSRSSEKAQSCSNLA
jgi:hypothetical protein